MAKKSRKNYSEDRIAHAIDDMAEFEEFKESILPALRADLKKGLSAQDIYEKYQSHAAARGISIALANPNPAMALSALKDILDRTQGKAKERRETTHTLANAKDEDIDAALLSKLGVLDADQEDDDTKH